MMMREVDTDTVATLLRIVADLLRGQRHSRQTIRQVTGKSLPTADRWIDSIAALPGARRIREGHTTWLVLDDERHVPSRSAAIGACVASSLGSIFEGSAHERNLKDARDFILKERGDTYADLDRKFVLAPRGGEYALPEAASLLDLIVEAILIEKRISFSYTHNNGERSLADIAPLSLVIFDHQFYVLGKGREGNLYPYRFARMQDVVRTEEGFAYPSKGEYEPMRLLAEGFGIHLSTGRSVENVEIVLSGPWAPYALGHRWHPTQQVTRLAGDSVRVSLRVPLCPELETWALGFGNHARIVAPEALRTVVAARLKAAAEAYAPRPPVRAVGKPKQGPALHPRAGARAKRAAPRRHR